MEQTQKGILEETAAVAGALGGATFGVLEVASMAGTVTGFTAGVAIGAGAMVWRTATQLA